ncbi:MAG: shikimate dehydrogenase family protein [Eggerthellaceae bacterium]|jgi:shikimate dehydrogenase
MDINVTGETHLISLIGKPIRHSMSPATHTLSFKKCGINAVYVAFEIDPEDLPDVLNAMRRMDGWDGSNVTMPCKQAIIPHLDGLSDAAKLMGAVNVIQKTEDGKLIGHNTDGLGFMDNLKKHGFDPKGKTMTLTGCGGAGSAILTQAALDGIGTLHVFCREGGPSYKHVQDLGPRVSKSTGCNIVLHAMENKDELRECIQASDVLANSTNVGMGHDCTDTPVPAEFIKEGMYVADAVYLPRVTQLLQDAEKKGCTIVPGIGMMNEQAAAGERIWYGIDMPTEEVAAELNSDKA